MIQNPESSIYDKMMFVIGLWNRWNENFDRWPHAASIIRRSLSYDWRPVRRPVGWCRFLSIVRCYQWQRNSLEWFIV